MTSDRIQRRVERLLDEAERALDERDWEQARLLAAEALALDEANRDAGTILRAAERLSEATAETAPPSPRASAVTAAERTAALEPSSFASGRYAVKRFLGEGGKKKVYLAHDTLLDRDVAFALIKTEGLDDVGRDRITREAQSMGRLGAHPHIVSVFDLGEEAGQPYIVTELMSGGDVEGLIEKAPEHRPPLERTLEIGIATCRGLEFAHSHGIVHRDLKPGNVWLTADGTAKLGDFGLAVALDKSRLTQAGMMVGTVSYMPPEQAMGAEVTPRSDLYSLGAMLYEMVTGRPPFVGDESVAIITQHLNTAPVSPSWHNVGIPPTLETLILRLLEKDPAKRPASAPEVREALASIVARPGAPTREEASPAAPPGDNPMYRRTFVGRESELRQLQAAYDAALSGQGSLVMIVGEPGIGKTSLTEQLATYAAVRGGKALIGHCYEEGSLSLPYLPFVEAMRSYVLAREPEGLRADLGSGAGDVGRIVSEVRDRVQVDMRPAGDPEEERWRLLQAVSGFLRNASAVQPLLLILEDLHDADRGTLDLLVHLAHNLGGARLLIAGTYRDVEVDRSHPLSGAMAELRRGGNFLRVPLRGLTAEEVQRMMASASQQDIPWPLAELVHRQTEGNPLFVQEMLRYLVEEGLVERRDGSLRRVGDETLAGRIPEGLRDVIGKRLSRLSEKTNQVLSVAAVVGREFRLDVLQRVLGIPEEELYAALEEANGAAVVEQRQAVGTVGLRFTHAFFRQTLYEEIFVPRRIRVHQQVGRALEAIYGRRLEEHAAELAEHFAQSTEREDLAKALDYCELAAKRAMSVYAYGEAERHLRQALKVQEVLDPDDRAKWCDLLLDLGAAMLPGEEPRRVADSVATEAFALAEALGDPLRAARSAVMALDALQRGAQTASRPPEFLEWALRADRYAPTGSPERIYADIYLGIYRVNITGPASGHPYLRRGAEAALKSDSGPAFFMAAGWTLRFLLATQDRAMVYAIADEFLRRPRDGARSGDLGVCLHVVGHLLLERGERAAAERAWSELKELASRTRDTSVIVRGRVPDLTLALLDGRLDDVLLRYEEVRVLSEQLGVRSEGFTRLATLRALIYSGQALRAMESFSFESGRIALVQRGMCLAHLDRHDEARAIRETFSGVGSDDDESGVHVLVGLLETAILCGDRETVTVIARRLESLAASACETSNPVCLARLLGDAADLLGDAAAARRYYEQALDVAGKICFRPEPALTHLGLAELLLEGADKAQHAEALGHLDFAIAEFRDMKMQPSLERALRHKEVLKA